MKRFKRGPKAFHKKKIGSYINISSCFHVMNTRQKVKNRFTNGQQRKKAIFPFRELLL